MGNPRIWITIAIIAAVTAAIRFLPFLIFGKRRELPRVLDKLGRLLPFAVIGMLVVYCLKDISFKGAGGFLPELIACAVVALIHIWRRNTSLSIIAGTVAYMLLVQLVF